MNTDASVSPVDSERFEVACDWFVRLREQPESQELVAAWLEWYRSDERNRAAFEEVRELWCTTGVIQHAPPGTASATVSQPRGPQRSRVVLLAATIAALAIGIGLLLTAQRTATNAEVRSFATAPSEHGGFTLSDGSRIELAGDSSVRTTLRAHVRDIELLRGEAYFRVAHDKARPFIVHANALHVRAVGTSFDVRTSGDRVVVAVEEGSVVVERRPESSSTVDSVLSLFRTPAHTKRGAGPMRPLNLRGGQEVAVGMPTQELQLLPIEPAAVASWREGRLRFAREPLGSVIASVRAATGRDIEVANAEIGDLRFTGTVFSARVDAWVEGLPAIFPVTVRQEGETLMIAPRE
ncbi:MAG TPA: FecR domain-containing protein [Steroidobacteraceae bacterium]|nr:FecR domain-containing protein [Steroidobacteraceae bacterium]